MNGASAWTGRWYGLPPPGALGAAASKVGTVADSGTALFVLGDLSDLVVEVSLTEDMLSFIEEGQPVRIRPRSGDGVEVRANLSRISPFLDAGSFTTTAEIDLDEAAAGLRPGMFVTVDILYGESERATLVPASALWEDPRTGVQGIYVFPEAPGGLREPSPEAEPGEGERPDDPSQEAFPVELRTVEVVAAGRELLGVQGVEAQEWVVVVGQKSSGGGG